MVGSPAFPTIAPADAPVPPRIFKAEAADDPNAWFKTKAYPSVAGMQYIVDYVLRELGVSQRGLNGLLGVDPEHNYTYRWLNGVKRPAPLYLTRMMVLLKLRAEGHQIVKWRRVDWDTGEIELRLPRGENGHLHTQVGRHLPNLESQPRVAVASSLAGHKERPGSLPHAEPRF